MVKRRQRVKRSKDSMITEDFLKENLEAGSKAKNIPKTIPVCQGIKATW